MIKLRQVISTAVLMAALCAPGVGAQQLKTSSAQLPPTPYPPLQIDGGSGQSTTGTTSTDVKQESAQQPSGPISGVRQPPLDPVGGTRSYLVPSLGFAQVWDSNPLSNLSHPGAVEVSTLFGRVDLQRVTAQSQLVLKYAGDGVYSNQTDLNTTAHQFGVAETITGRRWSLNLDNYLSYLPEAAFGYAGFGVTNVGESLGGGVSTILPVLGPNIVPNQSISTARTSRLSDAFAVQAGYYLTPRSSITVAGVYGVLHFFSPGFINSSNESFQVGYNYDLTSKDTLALFYGVSLFQFKQTGFDDHSIGVSFAHRITGRLGFQVSAGSQIDTFNGLMTHPSPQYSWNFKSSLNYRFQKMEVNLSAFRYTNAGSGVLTGATTYVVQGAVSRQLGRMWSASWNAGYARNSSLQQNATSGESVFKNWYSGVGINRQVGRSVSLFLNYNLQKQDSSVVACPQTVCPTGILRHQIWFGVQWQFHPIRLD